MAKSACLCFFPLFLYLSVCLFLPHRVVTVHGESEKWEYQRLQPASPVPPKQFAHGGRIARYPPTLPPTSKPRPQADRRVSAPELSHCSSFPSSLLYISRTFLPSLLLMWTSPHQTWACSLGSCCLSTRRIKLPHPTEFLYMSGGCWHDLLAGGTSWCSCWSSTCQPFKSQTPLVMRFCGTHDTNSLAMFLTNKMALCKYRDVKSWKVYLMFSFLLHEGNFCKHALSEFFFMFWFLISSKVEGFFQHRIWAHVLS